YAVPYLARVADGFGLGDHWAYRRSYLDKEWFGLPGATAAALLAGADAVFNVAGATPLAEEGLRAGNLVYFGPDPVIHEIGYDRGDGHARKVLAEHAAVVTYGENVGTPACPLPPLPRLRARTRQPVLLDLWEGGPPARDVFTTVGNWRQGGLDLDFRGETYRWSKHHEFLKFLDLPRRTGRPFELAMSLAEPESIRHGSDEVVPALGLARDERRLLEEHGWRLTESRTFTTSPWPYRDYVRASRGEFTVAKDQNVRLRSGWFSERSACYLSAGRPVVTQDTGFGVALPTGEGLFAFNTLDDILAAFDAIESDHARHSRAARAIAQEYFRAETVLAKLLADLGF